MSPSGRRRKLPGCGSPWNRPSSKSWRNAVSSTMCAPARCAAPPTSSASSSFTPPKYSSVSTVAAAERRRGRAGCGCPCGAAVRLLEGADVLRLVHEVQLLVDGPVELLDDPHRRVDARLLHHRLEQLRQRAQDLQVRRRSASGCPAAGPSPPPPRRRASSPGGPGRCSPPPAARGSMLAKASSGDRPSAVLDLRARTASSGMGATES